MTTVIVTGVSAVRAAVGYHRRLRRYVVEIIGEGVTVEFVLTAEQARQLLNEFRQQEHKVKANVPDDNDPRPAEKEHQR